MRVFSKILLGVATVLGGLVLAVPFVVPPIAEELATRELAKLGIHANAHMKMGFCWTSTGPGLDGTARLSVPDTPWSVRADFSASPCQWHANVKLGETAFNEADVLVRTLLTRYPVTAVSNLTFSGRVSFSATADRTFAMPVPVWSAKVKLRDADMDALSGESPLRARNFNVSAGVSGIAGHFDIDPMFPRVSEFCLAGLALTNFFASVRASERRLLVTEARGGLYGGTASVFSLFLDTQSLNSGFTLYLDDIDAGEALTAIKGFKGRASGRLHGKLKMGLRGGGARVAFREAFLYSVPGETGRIQFTDSSAITDNLALAGVDEAQRSNVTKALSNLDYTVLRLNLDRLGNDSAALAIRLEGTAVGRSVSAPVVLNVTLRGDLNQIVNTGLSLTGKGKQ